MEFSSTPGVEFGAERVRVRGIPETKRESIMARFMVRKEEKDIQIGLDIGSHSVKAVAISHSGPKPKLLNFSVKPVGGNIVKAIKDAHAELGFVRNKIVTSISGPTVIVRYVEMPSMTEEELRSATQFEAEKVIPYKIDEVELDSAKIEDLKGNRMRVVIVAAKKDLIDSQLKMVYETGLEPVALDVDSFAMMSAFTNAGIDSGSVCGLLNIGAKRSNLNIIKGRISYLSRDINIGGSEITGIIAENLSLTEVESERIKKERLSRFLQLSGEEKKGVEAPLEEVLSRLADEVRLSFDFYENHYASSVDKVYISGGTSKPKVVESLLKESLGRETLKWNPLVNIDVSERLDRLMLNESQPQLVVAVGLGLRRIEHGRA